jgi:hypothetical protein
VSQAPYVVPNITLHSSFLNIFSMYLVQVAEAGCTPPAPGTSYWTVADTFTLSVKLGLDLSFQGHLLKAVLQDLEDILAAPKALHAACQPMLLPTVSIRNPCCHM